MIGFTFMFKAEFVNLILTLASNTAMGFQQEESVAIMAGFFLYVSRSGKIFQNLCSTVVSSQPC